MHPSQREMNQTNDLKMEAMGIKQFMSQLGLGQLNNDYCTTNSGAEQIDDAMKM
jgi:hypothetical protein